MVDVPVREPERSVTKLLSGNLTVALRSGIVTHTQSNNMEDTMTLDEAGRRRDEMMRRAQLSNTRESIRAAKRQVESAQKKLRSLEALEHRLEQSILALIGQPK